MKAPSPAGATGLAAIALSLIIAAASYSQDTAKPGKKPAIGGEPDWMSLHQPGEHHQVLDPLVGQWNLKVTFASAGQGEPSHSIGTARFRWVMGKRYLIEETRTSWDGETFEWMGIHGYDAMRKKHVSTWIDNLGTGIDAMEGDCDAAGRTITYTAMQDNPAGTGKTHVKWILTIESNDRFTVKMFEGDKGKEAKVVDIVGSRA